MSTADDAASTPSGSTQWSRIPERGSLWAIEFGAWCHRKLGRPFGLALAHLGVGYLFLTDRAGRRASRAYLRRVGTTAQGRRSLRRPPGLFHSFLHYRAFALSILDRVDMWLGRGSRFGLEVHGSEHFDWLEKTGSGAIVMGAHLGSFDALRLLADRQHWIANVLMFTAHARRINTIFRELSADAEARVIEVDPHSVQSVFEIRSCLRRGELVAILGDRVEAGDRRRTSRVPFLGDAVELPQAPFLLASLLGAPVLLMLALRTGSAHYTIFIEKLAERIDVTRQARDKAVTELMTAYAGRLEEYCARYPYQWFNFFDYWGDAPRA
jgi:predicted LPLAT superfamily acyltransferase